MLNISVRAATRGVRSLSVGGYRRIHQSRSLLAAHAYGMPAMSPTMESGAIVEWKVKEGDKFNSGDTLLDIETDKATISVDAIDDGIVAKILLPDGTKDIDVGTPIAIFADEGDDLAELEYHDIEKKTDKAAPAPAPAPASSAAPTASVEAKASETKEESKSFASTSANTSQHFLPSVELLLEQNHISREDALSKITATGPSGRILKGDVLAYLGSIKPESNTTLAEYLEKTSHLDLSNIKLREGDSGAPTKETETPKQKVKEPVTITKLYSIAEDVGYPQLRRFRGEIDELIELAEQEAYAHKYEPDSELDDPLFDDLVAPPRNAGRFTVDYKVNFEDNQASSLDLTVTLNEKCYDAQEKADYFVSKFTEYLEANHERHNDI